jgi:hypothetical protein
MFSIYVFQTLKFSKDLGRYTGLRAICVLGGDSMEKQFALMHENPVSFCFNSDLNPRPYNPENLLLGLKTYFLKYIIK